jgi:hypothetical protein
LRVQVPHLLVSDLHIPIIRPRVLLDTSPKTSDSEVARRDQASQ